MRLTISVAVIASLLTPAGSALANCADILSQGAFTTERINRSTWSREEFRRLQCASSFKSHDEARAVGLGVTVPVYGVPVLLSGDFSEQQRERWKSAHCSAAERVAEFAATLESAKTIVPELVFQEWGRCMALELRGLQCQVEGDADVVSLRIAFAPRSNRERRPKIKSIQVTGASFAEGTRPRDGERVAVGGAQYYLRRERSANGAARAVNIAVNTRDGQTCQGILSALPPVSAEVVSTCVFEAGENEVAGFRGYNGVFGSRILDRECAQMSGGEWAMVEFEGSLGGNGFYVCGGSVSNNSNNACASSLVEPGTRSARTAVRIPADGVLRAWILLWSGGAGRVSAKGSRLIIRPLQVGEKPPEEASANRLNRP